MSAASERLDDRPSTEAVAENDTTALPLTAMAATCDCEESGDTVPPLWHWLHFLPVAPMAEVGADSHPKRGGFLPLVPLSRRRWAGRRLTFHADPGARTSRHAWTGFPRSASIPTRSCANSATTSHILTRCMVPARSEFSFRAGV